MLSSKKKYSTQLNNLGSMGSRQKSPFFKWPGGDKCRATKKNELFLKIEKKIRKKNVATKVEGALKKYSFFMRLPYVGRENNF